MTKADWTAEEVRSQAKLARGFSEHWQRCLQEEMLNDLANRIEADESARVGWDKECEDVDRIIEKLGLTVEQVRTEGGCLHLPRILNHIQETLDALASAVGFGDYMADKYVAAVHAANHPPAQPAQHDLYKRGDINIPSVIKGRNGDIVLALCKVCGRGEAELDEPCTTKKPAQEQLGWKWVPVMPTEEMLKASAIAWTGLCHGYSPGCGHYKFMDGLWRAMLDSSPTPPKEK